MEELKEKQIEWLIRFISECQKSGYNKLGKPSTMNDDYIKIFTMIGIISDKNYFNNKVHKDEVLDLVVTLISLLSKHKSESFSVIGDKEDSFINFVLRYKFNFKTYCDSISNRYIDCLNNLDELNIGSLLLKIYTYLSDLIKCDYSNKIEYVNILDNMLYNILIIFHGLNFNVMEELFSMIPVLEFEKEILVKKEEIKIRIGSRFLLCDNSCRKEKSYVKYEVVDIINEDKVILSKVLKRGTSSITILRAKKDLIENSLPASY